MKRIFSSQNPMIIHHMKNVLELEGIKAIIRNENLTTALGGIPATECWVELWILDENREAEAREIIRRKKEAEDVAIKWPWTCSRCGEKIEGQFTECWNCGESKFTSKKNDHQ